MSKFVLLFETNVESKNGPPTIPGIVRVGWGVFGVCRASFGPLKRRDGEPVEVAHGAPVVGLPGRPPCHDGGRLANDGAAESLD